MKKSFLALLVFALIFSYGGVSFAEEPALTAVQSKNQELQKIPSLAQVRNFTNIKKVGTSLMGIPKDSKANNSDKSKAKSTSTLEKIGHPNELKNFEKIQKIGSSLYGIRKGGTKKPVYVTSDAAACVKTAIDKKDVAVKASITARSEKVLAAIDARGVCQKLALDKTTANDQLEANKTCLKNFQQTITEANKLNAKVKNDSWKAYVADLKTCSALLKTTTSSTTEQIMIDDAGSAVDVAL